MAQSPALHLVCLGTKWVPFDGSGKTDHQDDPGAHARTLGSHSMSCPLLSAHLCACVGSVDLIARKLQGGTLASPFHR